MHSSKVGIREFRENLAHYLESETPVAITRHGATIGVYVPTRPKPSEEELTALRTAGQKLDELIEAAGLTDHQLVDDFKILRSKARKSKA